MQINEEWNKLTDELTSLYVFGAGKYGKKLLQLLERNGKSDAVEGVIVSGKFEEKDRILGYEIVPLDAVVDKTKRVLVSVADKHQDEVIELLMTEGFSNIVNAYKYTFLLDMVKTRVIELPKLIRRQMVYGEINRLDVFLRLKTIEDYYSGKPNSFDDYIRMQELRVGEGYGKKAQKRFMRLLDDVKKNGYDMDSEIVVDENYELIDGAHRLAVLMYYKKNYAKIRIKPDKDSSPFGIQWFIERFSESKVKQLVEYANEKIKLQSDIEINKETVTEKIELILGNEQEFGQGKFYQSLPTMGLIGQRPTDLRINEYKLKSILADGSVLDIGCNCGFFDIEISKYVNKVLGTDINENLIEIGNTIKDFLHRDNVEFRCEDFNNFTTNNTFDYIFSFAVHQWIKMSPKDYTRKLYGILNSPGYIIFESQKIEDDNLYEIICEEFKNLGMELIYDGNICDDGMINRKYSIYRKEKCG